MTLEDNEIIMTDNNVCSHEAGTMLAWCAPWKLAVWAASFLQVGSLFLKLKCWVKFLGSLCSAAILSHLFSTAEASICVFKHSESQAHGGGAGDGFNRLSSKRPGTQRC